MFTITDTDIRMVLHDYGIPTEDFTFTELERYRYEEEDPGSNEVRLIVKVSLPTGRSLVLRFKHEEDAPQEIMEAQSRFAALLYAHGIETPRIYASEGAYARRYTINGYDVTVMAEDFADGEIKLVDPKTAAETGELLARMHRIAEEADFHVHSEVLFDPLAPNDLSILTRSIDIKMNCLPSTASSVMPSSRDMSGSFRRSGLWETRPDMPFRATSATAICTGHGTEGLACSISTAAATIICFSMP